MPLEGLSRPPAELVVEPVAVISVRQTRGLPPASFKFAVAHDTLALGCILPTTGRIRDFHPLERAPAGRTTKKRGPPTTLVNPSTLKIP